MRPLYGDNIDDDQHIKQLIAENQHLKEEVDELMDTNSFQAQRIRSMISEIERLTMLDRQNNADMLDMMKTIKRLQARVDALTKSLESIASNKSEPWGDEFQEGLNIAADEAIEALEGG